jgi:hypothetical protein
MEAADRYVAGYLAQRKRLPFLAKGRCGRPDRHPDLTRRLACGQPAGRRCPHVRASGSRRGRSRNRGPGAVAAMLAVAGGPTDRRSDREQLSTGRAQSRTFVASLAPSSRSSAAPIGRPGRGPVRRQGRRSTRWTLSPGAGQCLGSTRTRPSTVPSQWPSSEARWLNRHLTMYGQEPTDGGRRVNASHRRQIPLGPGRVPGRPRR